MSTFQVMHTANLFLPNSRRGVFRRRSVENFLTTETAFTPAETVDWIPLASCAPTASNIRNTENIGPSEKFPFAFTIACTTVDV